MKNMQIRENRKLLDAAILAVTRIICVEINFIFAVAAAAAAAAAAAD